MKWLLCRILITLKILFLLSLKKNCGEKDLEAKRKLRYYKEVINPALEDENYLSVLKFKEKN